MELRLKTQQIELSLILEVGEQGTAQVLLAELAHAGVLSGTQDSRRLLMPRYIECQPSLQTFADVQTQHIPVVGHVPTQNVPLLGHVPTQHIPVVGHVPTQDVPLLGHVPTQDVPVVGHVPTQHVLPTEHVPIIPNRTELEPFGGRAISSPKWGLIAVLVGVAIGLLLLSWRWHTQQAANPEPTVNPTKVNQKKVNPTNNVNPPSFVLPKK